MPKTSMQNLGALGPFSAGIWTFQVWNCLFRFVIGCVNVQLIYPGYIYIYIIIYISYLNRLFRYESNQQFANAALTVQLLDLLVFDMKTLPLEDTIARMFA